MATVPGSAHTATPTHPAQAGKLGEPATPAAAKEKDDQEKDDRRCVTCGHKMTEHAQPQPMQLNCLHSSGCTCKNFVEGTAGSVDAVKKDEEEQKKIVEQREKEAEERAEKAKQEREKREKEGDRRTVLNR